MAGDIETSCVLIKPEALSLLVPLDYQPQSTIRVNADLLIVLVLVVVLVLDFLEFAARMSHLHSVAALKKTAFLI